MLGVGGSASAAQGLGDRRRRMGAQAEPGIEVVVSDGLSLRKMRKGLTFGTSVGEGEGEREGERGVWAKGEGAS